MQQQWSRPILFVLGAIALMLPGVRKMVFGQVLRNRLLRNMGLKFILSVPFLREKMMDKILPSRQPF